MSHSHALKEDQQQEFCNTPSQDNYSKLIESNRRHAYFKFIPVGELEAKAPEYVIDKILEKDTMCMVFGSSAAGKTFAVIDMLCCISTGLEFHGYEVKVRGTCIYICGEGHNGLARRFDAWALTNKTDISRAPVYVSETSAKFCTDDFTNEVLESVRHLAENHGEPVLIVVDTLARNFGNGDENSTKDMGIFIDAMDKLRKLYNSTIMIVHHTGHAETKRARGSSALRAALDAEFEIKKDAAGIIKLKATKMKDAELPEPMTFKLKPVELGFKDDDGNPVTSAVLETNEDGYPSPIRGKLGSNQSKALKIFNCLYDEKRKQLDEEDNDPDSAKVEIEEWNEACRKKGLSRQAFCDVKKSLPERGCIIIKDGYAYLPQL
jgi:hypothetical protein